MDPRVSGQVFVSSLVLVVLGVEFGLFFLLHYEAAVGCKNCRSSKGWQLEYFRL